MPPHLRGQSSQEANPLLGSSSSASAEVRVGSMSVTQAGAALFSLQVGWLGGLRTPLLLLAICSLPVLLYLPFLNEPFLRDEGFFASVAQLMLDGGIPYRDAFDNKPPLIFGWYSLSFLFFGESVWAPRLMVSLLLSATTLLVYIQGRLMFSQSAAFIAAAAFAVSTGFAAFETNANVEYFLLLPMMGGLVSFTMGQRTGRLPWFALAGFASGIAVLTKTTAVFSIALFAGILVWPLVRGLGGGAWRGLQSWRPVLMFAGGLGAAGLLVTTPFIVSLTFDDMFEALVWYSGDYVGDVPLTTKLWLMARAPFFFLLVTGAWSLVAFIGATKLVRARHPMALLVVAWVASSVVGVVVAGRFYPHYYVMLLPGLALLVPTGLDWLRQQWAWKPARVALAGVLLISFVVSSGLNLGIYAHSTADERHIAKYPDTPMAEWETQGPLMADWLRERTTPGDYIYNLGGQSEVYFYADRRSPTRFLFDYPFAINANFEDEAIRDLNERKPLYIFDSAIYEPDDWLANAYPEKVKKFVDENYEYVGKIYYADMYRLKD